jgi:hypothetical protein
MIPDRENGTWKFTNPPVHTQWSLEVEPQEGVPGQAEPADGWL